MSERRNEERKGPKKKERRRKKPNAIFFFSLIKTKIKFLYFLFIDYVTTIKLGTQYFYNNFTTMLRYQVINGN